MQGIIQVAFWKLFRKKFRENDNMDSKSIGGARAQSGIELASFFAILIFFFIIFTINAANQTSWITQNRDELEAEKIGGVAATNINIAFSVGDGYSANFSLPYGLTNSNYSINIYNSIQQLEIVYSTNKTKIFALLPSNVTGVPKQGQNLIRNIQGGISIV